MKNTENPHEFWDALNNLGPRKNNNISMQVYDNDGNVTGEINAVISKWKSEFQKLFQGYDQNEFDKDFYDFADNEKKRLEEIGLNINTDTYNAKISLEDIQKVLGKAPSINYYVIYIFKLL